MLVGQYRRKRARLYAGASNRTSSLRKNREIESFFFRVSVGGWAMDSIVGGGVHAVTTRALRCDQFGDADQVIGDQIEQEVGGDAAMPRCLVLRMVPCCLPQPKMHSVIARRDCDMP